MGSVAACLARWVALAALVVTLAAPAGAQSADRRLAPFFGEYAGTGIATDTETRAGSIVKIRDLDVVIRPTDAGFVLTWTTVLQHLGEDGRPHLHRRVTTYAFEPGPRPGWFRATESGDPLEGHPLVWARLVANTLTVAVYNVFEDGHNDLQIYTRRLIGQRMELEYTRSHNNERVAAVRGWLARIGD